MQSLKSCTWRILTRSWQCSFCLQQRYLSVHTAFCFLGHVISLICYFTSLRFSGYIGRDLSLFSIEKTLILRTASFLQRFRATTDVQVDTDTGCCMKQKRDSSGRLWRSGGKIRDRRAESKEAKADSKALSLPSYLGYESVAFVTAFLLYSFQSLL